MKRYNFLLSVLMVPAMILQGGQTTCTGGGSGSTPPAPSIGSYVIGFQTQNADGSYTFSIPNSAGAIGGSGTVWTLGASYGVWCTLPAGVVPAGGTASGTPPVIVPPPGPNNGIAAYTPYNYSSYTTSTAGGSFGVAGNHLDATVANINSASPTFTTPLTLVQEWNAVNWILNYATTDSNNPSDTQAAIWQILHPDSGLNYVKDLSSLGGFVDAGAGKLYIDALANTSFIPAAGQNVAVLMVPTTPANYIDPVTMKPAVYQGFVVPVKVVCTTATGSVSFTKTASVATANAFEAVTYTYTVTNTGSTNLQNIVIVDDNGTPNYSEDDVTINVSAAITTTSNPSGTLAAGAKAVVTSTVYLPISLFYQVGTASAFDTLIPATIPATSTTPTQLFFTYLIDSDVSDNTYGKGASAGWAGNGGHTFAQEEANSITWSLYNSIGQQVANFDANNLSFTGVTAPGATPSHPSGYSSSVTAVHSGNPNYISYVTSTLVDNLDLFTATTAPIVNSPIGDATWLATSGYKLIVNEGIYGMFGFSSNAGSVTNNLSSTKVGFSGKCGYAKGASYSPKIVNSKVTGTAYLCATVCGCTSVVHAKAYTCVTLNVGCSQPTCNNPSGHTICQKEVNCGCTCASCQAGNHGGCSAPVKCVKPVCTCTCAQCTAGNHGNCTKVGCSDPICQANKCNHNTVICKVNKQTYIW